jgi:hypothetical protein
MTKPTPNLKKNNVSLRPTTFKPKEKNPENRFQ